MLVPFRFGTLLALSPVLDRGAGLSYEFGTMRSSTSEGVKGDLMSVSVASSRTVFRRGRLPGPGRGLCPVAASGRECLVMPGIDLDQWDLA